MSTQRLKIEVNSLKEGMFVADLDRPWHETPFPLQGFYIRQDDDIKALVEAEDNDRIAAISDFFESHGYEEKEAFIRARVTYFTQLSYYALDVSEPMVQRMQYLETYFQCFTGRQISPEIAEDFRQRLVAWEQNK